VGKGGESGGERKRGEMTQTMYAHVNNNKKERLS
jgi:hypothetical protein